jgi:hypothetical protein
MARASPSGWVSAAVALGLVGAGCSHVPYKDDRQSGSARVVDARCTRTADAVALHLLAEDQPGPFEVKLARQFEATAQAPAPGSGSYSGPATLTFVTLLGPHELLAGTATWFERDHQSCVTIDASWSQGHMAESAPVGADGRLQQTTVHAVQLGPWCGQCSE